MTLRDIDNAAHTFADPAGTLQAVIAGEIHAVWCLGMALAPEADESSWVRGVRARRILHGAHGDTEE